VVYNVLQVFHSRPAYAYFHTSILPAPGLKW
jgi:hypothetical protein